MEFREAAVQDAINLYKSLETTTEQHNILKALSEQLAKFIPMSELAIRGYGLQAMRDWQVANNRPGADISSMTPAQRLEAMAEILGYLAKRFKRTLRTAEYEDKIDTGMQKLIDYYQKTHAQR
jgi:hypothetical protein